MNMRNLGRVTQLLFICFFVALSGGRPALAEGSRSLYPATYPAAGFRANLDLQSGSKYVGKISRRTFLYVYARAGEYILLGSSNRGSGGDIRVYSPQNFGTPGDETIPATAAFQCASDVPPEGSFGGAGRGIIGSRIEELAGPVSADGSGVVANGYSPCAYLAPADGLYGVEFTRATSGSAVATGSVDVIQPSTVSVAAWDVTVRASAASTGDINARLFTYAWTGLAGNDVGRPIYSSHYVVSSDGYRYLEDLRGLDPVGFVLYANRFGFLDNGQPLLKDIRGKENLVATLPVGVTTQIPQFPIFFSDISPTGPNNAEVETVLGLMGIPTEPRQPGVTNVSFTGPSGGAVTTPGAGGTFQFDTTDTVSYEIIVSRDGVNFDPVNTGNRVLSGIAGSGTQIVAWDGKDSAGNNFPSSSRNYSYRIVGHNGDIHLPIIDPENNPGMGPTVTRLNGASSPSTLVYYDDRGYRTGSGVLIGNLNGTLCDTATPAGPTVPVSLAGVDSTSNYRDWEDGANSQSDCVPGAGWGDSKGVNLWTHFSTPPRDSVFSIRAITIDVGTSITAPANVAAGSPVQGTFSFFNNGSSRANGVSYGMSMKAGLGTVVFGNLPDGVTAAYNNGTGVVTLNGLPARLEPGQSIPFMTFSFTAPVTGPVLVNTNIDTTGTDEFPDNNTASFSIGVGASDVFAGITAPAVAVAGSTVGGTLTFGNGGAEQALNVTYTARFGSSAYFPPTVAFTGLPAGASASYDNTSGRVTFTGMPTTLAAGEIITIGFSYQAPASGDVPIAAGVATTSSDANPGNNDAAATVLVAASAGKQSQSPLFLKAGRKVACCGRPVLLKAKGGSVKAPVTFRAVASGAVSCKLVSSGSRTFLKIRGERGAGSCTVTAFRKGNGTYNPVASNSVVIRLR